MAVLAKRASIYVAANGRQIEGASQLTAELLAAGGDARSLGHDTTTLTAIANDYGFEQTYARQLRALMRPGDILVVLQGREMNEPNLDRAVDIATERRAHAVSLVAELELNALLHEVRTLNHNDPAST